MEQNRLYECVHTIGTYDGAGSNDCFIALPNSGSKKLLHYLSRLKNGIFMQGEV